ncbi:MFS transporter [Vagococcus jeotgali]|uniref:MFS transporter n=1 Tax=Vagococcus jeotgali TaxID=3109030 RepID=UPI002DD8E417|nr:MFS transporter [Vagococcus sp. B2T-5]
MPNVEKNKFTPFAVLSVSFILTSGVTINGTLPFIKDHFNLSQTQSELLGTLPSFTVVIFILLSNYLTKKIGMKQVVIIGLIMASIGGVLPWLTPNSYGLIVFGRLLLGAGLGMYNALSVSFINGLFTGKERSTLLGFRNATESIGQMILTFVAGLLLMRNWMDSYLIYLLAIPIAILFYLYVPNIEAKAKVKTVDKGGSFSWVLLLTILIVASLLMNAIAIGVRFPTLAIELAGQEVNASAYLALMPILGIVAGILFEKIVSKVSFGIVFLGIGFNILSDFLIGFSTQSFWLLTIGLFLSSIPIAWVIPFIFNHIEELGRGIEPNKATSYVFVGCNFGVFLAPMCMNWASKLLGSSDLRLPFIAFGIIFTIVLVILISIRKKIEQLLIK